MTAWADSEKLRDKITFLQETVRTTERQLGQITKMHPERAQLISRKEEAVKELRSAKDDLQYAMWVYRQKQEERERVKSTATSGAWESLRARELVAGPRCAFCGGLLKDNGCVNASPAWPHPKSTSVEVPQL